MAENMIQQDPVDLEDDRPLAVRRKRRLSSGLTGSTTESRIQKTEDDVEQPIQPAKTPSRRKKRVRFSDPGPDSSSIPSSTGLTPHLKRTSFSPREYGSSSSRTPAGTSRRFSLPAQLFKSLPSPSLSPSPVPFSGEIQFEPLRQILEPRLKRRLRRNGLSEEVNNIEADQKEMSKWRQENQDLKSQLILVQQARDKEHSDNGAEEATSSEKVLELEQQIAGLKDEMRERSATIDLTTDDSMPHERRSSPGITIFEDNVEDNLVLSNSDEDGSHQDVAPVAASTEVNEVATQTSLLSPNHVETFREARLSLEYLFPGEIILGLIPHDPKPLLDIMLDRMRDLKAEVMFTENSLSSTQAQESNLRNQFNAVLAQLDRARDYAETIRTINKNEKCRADGSEARVKELENIVQDADNKVDELERDADEKDRSILKLQNALETYRSEVKKLESLIMKTDEEHNTSLSGLRAEMDEAVADLECHVVAETRGRREAEQEVAERDEHIKQLQHQEQELKHALNEKQQIIRETERIFEEERVGRAREVGGLNVHIGQLSTDLSESNAKVLDAEEKQRELMRKLREEREAGVQAVEAVQAELARCKEKAEDVKTSYVTEVQRRGAEVTQSQGLLTPVTTTRFKDVEGYVEVRRGASRSKKRPDSGIVILEEDEDTVMADDL